MNNLVRITKTLKDKGIMVYESEVAGLIDPNTAYFQSLYYYPQDALAYFDKAGSIKGYKGQVYTPFIVFDIDSKDLDESKAQTIILVDWLKSKGLYDEYACKIAFSGSKGFHLVINTEYSFTHRELKTLCMFIASQISEETGKSFKIDPSIYNHNRQFRLVNTPNEKSGLYKIEMVESELRQCTMDVITAAAATPKPTYLFEKSINCDIVKGMLSKISIKPSIGEHKPDIIKRFMGSSLPKKHCIAVLQQGDMKDGESNSGLLRLASYYRKAGYNQDQARNKLLEAAANRLKMYPACNEITLEKIDQEILYSVYSTEGYTYSCSDWFLKDKCGGNCDLMNTPKVETPKVETQVRTGFKAAIPIKQTTNEVITMQGFRKVSESAQAFKIFAEDWQKHRIETGIEEFDKYVRILPNGLTIVNAKASVGKTTIALNCMINGSRRGQTTLFYCIDMAEDEFFTKIQSKVLGISPDDVLDLYYRNDAEANELKREAIALTEEALKNVHINYSTSLNVEQIDRDLAAFKNAGIEINLVVIDYLQKMKGAADYANATDMLHGLKSLITKYKVPILGLSQIPRGGGDEETPIYTAAAAQGGSIYEQNASICINLWRPMKFAGDPKLDTAMGYAISKNRMGECRQGVLYFDGAVSDIRSMTPTEAENHAINFEAYRQTKNDIKKGRF